MERQIFPKSIRWLGNEYNLATYSTPPPSFDENSSEDVPGPPPLVSSDSDDQADEQIRRPVVLTDSETDSDSDSNTVVMPVRNPDGSVELRQLPIALAPQVLLRGRSVNFI